MGYSLLDFDYSGSPNQHNLITNLSLKWKYNSKTSSDLSLSRATSPSATGQSTISTSLRSGLNHRFTDTWSGSAYISTGLTDYTTITEESYSMSNHGLGVNLSKKISQVLSASGGYDLSYSSSRGDSFVRHVLHGEITGRF